MSSVDDDNDDDVIIYIEKVAGFSLVYLLTTNELFDYHTLFGWSINGWLIGYFQSWLLTIALGFINYFYHFAKLSTRSSTNWAKIAALSVVISKNNKISAINQIITNNKNSLSVPVNDSDQPTNKSH